MNKKKGFKNTETSSAAAHLELFDQWCIMCSDWVICGGHIHLRSDEATHVSWAWKFSLHIFKNCIICIIKLPRSCLRFFKYARCYFSTSYCRKLFPSIVNFPELEETIDHELPNQCILSFSASCWDLHLIFVGSLFPWRWVTWNILIHCSLIILILELWWILDFTK